MKGMVRILAVFGLVAGLLFSASASAEVKTASNGIVSITISPTNVPYGSFTTALTVDCGDPTATCQAFVGRNGIFPQTLFATVHGTLTNAPINFIADGCYNFSVYAGTDHMIFEVAVNAGHSDLIAGNACTGSQPNVASFGRPTLGVSPTIIGDPQTTTTVEWDSGFAGGIEDAVGWIWKNTAANPLPLVNGVPTCPTAGVFYPNKGEVLYSQYPNKSASDLRLIGGGPYCFSLYHGTEQFGRLTSTVQVSTEPYLRADSSNTIYFNTADSAQNGAVCVWGAVGGTINNQILLTYNSQGYGSVPEVSGFNGYYVFKGVTLGPGGQPTNASCNTGTLVKSGNT